MRQNREKIAIKKLNPFKNNLFCIKNKREIDFYRQKETTKNKNKVASLQGRTFSNTKLIKIIHLVLKN